MIDEESKVTRRAAWGAWTWVLTIATGCGPSSTSLGSTPKTSGPTTHPPRLVVVVIDQLASWELSERIDKLPRDGGFARLRREGLYVPNMRYAHAVTDTAPGHAALFTGQTPNVSGIFGNEVIEETSGQRVSILRDKGTFLVGAKGTLERPGSSLQRLRVETLADRFRTKYNDAAIVAVSLKDRGALFAAGRTPTAAVWFDTKTSSFVTSTAFGQTLPDWVRIGEQGAAKEGLAAAASGGRFATAKPWVPLDPAWLASVVTGPDDAPGEGDLAGFGRTFPHEFSKTTEPALAFRASPHGDEAIVAMARDFLATKGVQDKPLLLTLSLSSHDYIGHVFGPSSWESWDELLRLDRKLSELLQVLDARFGTDGYDFLLSADHGVTPMPETRRDGRGGRILQDAMTERLQREVGRLFGNPKLVAGVADPYVFFSEAARRLSAEKRLLLQNVVTETLLAYAHVGSVVAVPSTALACPPENDETRDAMVCRSMTPGAVDGVYVIPTEGAFFDANYVVGFGTSHGTPTLEDRTVPLLVRGPGRIPAGRLEEKPASFQRFFLTALSLLGISRSHQP